MRWVALAAVVLMSSIVTRVAAHDGPCGYRLVPSNWPFAHDRDRIRNLLLDGKFDELDAIEVKSRDLSQRTVDGHRLRVALFAGIGSSLEGATECLGHKPDESRPILEEINARMMEKVQEWRRVRPESHAAPIADAMLHSDKAWVVRGSSYATDVPEEAWPVFNGNLKQAVEILDALDPSFRTDPAWIAPRLSLSALVHDGVLAEDWPKAMATAKDYEPIWDIGANFMQEKWGGSDEKFARFLDSILDAKGGPSHPYEMYARTAWEYWSMDMFSSGRVRWEPMKRGFDEIVTSNPDPWNVNSYARIACIAGDWETARSMLPRIEKPIPDAWGTPTYRDCVRAAKPRITPWMMGGGVIAVGLLLVLWLQLRRRRDSAA